MKSTLTYARIDWPPVATALGAKDWKTWAYVPGVVSFEVDADGRLLEWRDGKKRPQPCQPCDWLTFIKSVNRVDKHILAMQFDSEGVLKTCLLTSPGGSGQKVLMDRSGLIKALQAGRRGEKACCAANGGVEGGGNQVSAGKEPLNAQ